MACMAMAGPGDGILSKLLERQHVSVDKWKSSSILDYCEDVAVQRTAARRLARKELIFSGGGAVQSMAISDNCEYLATGHTSNDHPVMVHALRPRFHVTSTLLGHRRTPWCLTFDPCHRNIIYSGCLGGVVKKWNFESSCLLATFDSGAAAPITNVIPLPTSNLVLVGAKFGLYSLSSEQLSMLWFAPCSGGIILRLVKYLPQERKLLTAKKLPEATDPSSPYHTYRLQVIDFDPHAPPHLNDTSTGILTECPLVPNCFAITTKQVVFYSQGIQVLSTDGTGRCTLCHEFQPGKELSFMAVSPSERYLLLVYHRRALFRFHHGMALIDLEAKRPVSSEDLEPEWDIDMQPLNHVNCGFWMPLTSTYPMHLFLADKRGHLLSLDSKNS